MDDLRLRAIELLEAPAEERIIEARIAPINEPHELYPGVAEMFLPGSFTRSGLNDGRIAVKLETGHGHAGPVVGRLEALEERSDAVYGTLRISATRDGDDALALARDGAVGISVGFLIGDASRSVNDGIETTEIRSVDLREVTLTGTPVYQSAEPIAVRSTNREDPEMENENTVDQATEVAELVRSAVDAAVDEIRTAAVVAPPVIEAEHRGHNYRTVGDVLTDTIARRRRSPGHEAATERLTRSIELGLVNEDGSAINLRAFAEVGNSIGDSTPNEVYIPELLTLLREGRPTADLFDGRALPADGNKIELPEVSVGSKVGYQDGEGTTVEDQKQTWILDDRPKATIAGGQGVTLQAQMWSNPSYMDEVVRDLLADYSEFLDGQTINGDPTVDTPASLTGYTGILNAGATDIPVTGDVKAALALVGTGWAAVYAGSRRSPIAAIMHSTIWGAFLDAVDTDGRPLVTTDAPANPAGIGNAASIAGTLRSIPVVLDDSAPADLVILGSFRDALLFEDSGTPAQIALTYPDVLTTDVSVYGFSSLFIRRPAAFAVLSGITVP